METFAAENDGVTVHRSGTVVNGFRNYDPTFGGYLQADPLMAASWSSYVYANSDPVGRADVFGLMSALPCASSFEYPDPDNQTVVCVPRDPPKPGPHGPSSGGHDPSGGGDVPSSPSDDPDFGDPWFGPLIGDVMPDRNIRDPFRGGMGGGLRDRARALRHELMQCAWQAFQDWKVCYLDCARPVRDLDYRERCRARGEVCADFGVGCNSVPRDCSTKMRDPTPYELKECRDLCLVWQTDDCKKIGQ